MMKDTRTVRIGLILLTLAALLFPRPAAAEQLEPQRAADSRRVLPVELYLAPGVSLYGDTAGFGAALGLMSSLGELFKVPSALGALTFGVSARYDGALVFVDDLDLNIGGGAVLLGYRILPANLFGWFPSTWRFDSLRLTPRAELGLMYQQLERRGREAYSGSAIYIAPGILADISLTRRARVGLLTELNLSYGDDRWISSVHLGPFASWSW